MDIVITVPVSLLDLTRLQITKGPKSQNNPGRNFAALQYIPAL